MRDITVTITLDEKEYAELKEIAERISKANQRIGYTSPLPTEPDKIIRSTASGVLLNSLKSSLALSLRCVEDEGRKIDESNKV